MAAAVDVAAGIGGREDLKIEHLKKKINNNSISLPVEMRSRKTGADEFDHGNAVRDILKIASWRIIVKIAFYTAVQPFLV